MDVQYMYLQTAHKRQLRVNISKHSFYFDSVLLHMDLFHMYTILLKTHS